MRTDCTQGKICYRSEAETYRAASKSGARNVTAYQHDGHWHFSRTVPRLYKHSTPQHSTGPAPFTPSAKTLRGRLENASREIRAADKALAKSEGRKADAELRAAHILKQSELQTELELQAISEMIGRLQR